MDWKRSIDKMEKNLLKRQEKISQENKKWDEKETKKKKELEKRLSSFKSLINTQFDVVEIIESFVKALPEHWERIIPAGAESFDTKGSFFLEMKSFWGKIEVRLSIKDREEYREEELVLEDVTEKKFGIRIIAKKDEGEDAYERAVTRIRYFKHISIMSFSKKRLAEALAEAYKKTGFY